MRRTALLRAKQAMDAARQREAMAKARAVAELLKNKYGARAVFLYGSLAWGGFHDASDIDLLVEGFRGDFWPMYLEAERLAAPFELNLVLAEEAGSSLFEAVTKGGIPL